MARTQQRTYRTVRAQTLHYLARPHNSVPTRPLEGPSNWLSAAHRDEDTWTYHLCEADIEGIETTLKRPDIAATPMERLGAVDMPFSEAQIDQWRQTLTHGRGFLRIRGVPVTRWPLEYSERFFWILGQHLGAPGAQNGEGHLLGHVRDLRLNTETKVRQYNTNAAINYHCDAADAVGLLCVKTAKSGGLSRIASSVAIFNRLLEDRPDLVPWLFKPLAVDTRGDGGTDSFVVAPSAYYQGRLRTFYHGEYFRTAQEHPQVKPLTTTQYALLDHYDALANDPTFYLQMELAPGDIQLISNHTIVHSRTGYEDHDDPAERRHLLRLWLSLEPLGGVQEKLLRARALTRLIGNLVHRKRTLKRIP